MQALQTQTVMHHFDGGNSLCLCVCAAGQNLDNQYLVAMRRNLILTAWISCITALCGIGQTDILDSGGKLTALQASYDVTHYGLELSIDPEKQWIGGSLTVTARVVEPMEVLELDLDTVYDISSVVGEGKAGDLAVERDLGKIHIKLGRKYQAGEFFTVTVAYSGNPRVAPNPPWAGGFTWDNTPSEAHWIATSCQGQGADLWWPCKDNVSDEPDSMDLRISVPTGL